jgi:predicted RNA-binding protein with PUA-like domain
MNYWLIKSEPDCFGIDDLKREKKAPWSGVRNYQARNFMRDKMRVGDLALFYHSSCDPMGIVGIAKVASKAHSDLTALNKKDEHFDPKSTKENPIWYCVDFAFKEKFKRIITRAEIKADPILQHMIVAQNGIRLSIMPVSEKEFARVLKLAK